MPFPMRKCQQTHPLRLFFAIRFNNLVFELREIKSDYNSAGGTYQLEGESFKLEIEPSTLAFGGEDSLDQQYLELLNKVQYYSIEDGYLVLSLENDGGRMTFNQQ